MSNNDIMKKLRVALKLNDQEIVDILKLVDFSITKAELGAIFRNKEHENFKPCGDQILRNFLNGLIIYKRGPKPEQYQSKLIFLTSGIIFLCPHHLAGSHIHRFQMIRHSQPGLLLLFHTIFRDCFQRPD
ncbi:hypothetical protein FGO68_gene11567 [Halteria grandinella]|uniref:DUF1456 family protein n=3 Tax=cellular organisms TaxID=131567 RepID=A0A8J8N9E5_HALGN|nr:hypothetical protein FGO68_gene11567 [Halteria grandinella]